MKTKESSRQLVLFKSRPRRKDHGGSLSFGKRRSKRPLSTKMSLHITLKSHQAVGARCLLRHRKLIQSVMRRAAHRFRIRIYNFAVAGNHLHLSIKGRSREDLQNFFRVFAGHTAQKILEQFPLKPGGAPVMGKEPCRKNRRKFWSYLIYSRIVTWGREYKRVLEYITRNTLEALHLIAYRPRRKAISIKDTG